jgi:hypothetical protein
MEEFERKRDEVKARSRRRLRILLFVALLLGSQAVWMGFWPEHPLNTWNQSRPLDLEKHWKEQAERNPTLNPDHPDNHR